jgi:adenine-specific DNA-methyltransferase
LKDKEYIQYINELGNLLKSKWSDLHHSFFLLYLIAYSLRYVEMDNWPRKTNKLSLEELKIEASLKISHELYSSWDVSSSKNYEIIHWLLQNPPLDTSDDILGDIYLLCSSQRKQMGEHYTRPDLVAYICDNLPLPKVLSTQFVFNSRIIDPACGSGNFVSEIIKRALSQKNETELKDIVDHIFSSNCIVGVDIQEGPCLLTKIRILMDVVRFIGVYDPAWVLPVYCANSLIDKIEPLEDNLYDIVITNPPYLRYQSIPKEIRMSLSENYISAQGSYDLYVLFIEKAMRLAKNKVGQVCILCSDKFMTSAYGKGIRQYVPSIATLTEVLDLSDIFPFKAAVLSAVYYFRNEISNDAVSWKRISASNEGFKSEKLGTIEMGGIWRYVNDSSEHVFKFLNELELSIKLRHFARKIFVGIKTTADEVFCKTMTNEFVEQNEIESELVFPFLRGRNLRKWGFNWTGNKENRDTNILYPYTKIMGRTTVIGLEEYPGAAKYLFQHRDKLSARDYINESSKQWFEIWVTQSHNHFQNVKIMTPDISSSCMFSLDTQGYFCNGTVYCIQLDEQKNIDDYKYLLGILNSKVMEFYHKKSYPTKIHSNKYRFQTSTMENYPIIELPHNDQRFSEIVSIVNTLIAGNGNTNESEELLNKVVYNIYGLEKCQIAIIEEFVRGN